MTLPTWARRIIGEDGKLPPFAWPGGYDVLYLCDDGEFVCAGCAQEALDEELDWRPVGFELSEGIETDEFCAHCGQALNVRE